MSQSGLIPKIGAGLAVGVAVGLLVFTPLESALANKALALCVVSIGLLATGVIAEYLTALLFFTVAMLAAIAPPETVFAGFSSSAFWLVFAGMFLGAATEKTGLAARLARQLSSLFGHSQAAILFGVAGFGLLLCFVMPSSMGRVILVLPILAALADHLGYAATSKGRSGIILTGVFATFLPAFAILPANVPNMVLVGTAEALYSHSFTYLNYMLLHFPVFGLLRTVLIAWLALLLFRETPDHDDDSEPLPPMGRDEKRLALILIGALAFWITDSFHGISPAWIGMAAALLVLAPRFGPLAETGLKGFNVGPLLVVAGVIGLGAMVAYTGLGKLAANWFLELLPLAPGQDFANLSILSAVSALTAMLTTLPGVPAVMSPISGDLATASGLSLHAVLMTQVIGFSIVILPYQAPPLLVAARSGKIAANEISRFCLIIAVATLAITPLQIGWMMVMGLS